jgi:hypothetical protein
MFGIYRAQIVRSIYPDDKDNSRGDRMEYVVRVRGQEYNGATDVTDMGGIHNYSLRVRKETTESSDGELRSSTYREKMNGETVFVMFIEGNGNIPLIVGSDQHPRHNEYNKTSREEGMHQTSEFNGIEISIDKLSNYTIKNVGRKNDKGDIENEAGVGSHIKIYENGDIELDTHDTDDTANLRMKLTKADKKMEFYAQDNKVVYDAAGVSIIDKNANEFKFTADGLAMKSVAKTNMESAADTSIKSGGKADIKATGEMMVSSDAKATFKGTAGTDVGTSAAPTKVDGATVMLAGGAKPVATLGCKAIGVGNLGAPVVSTIIQGSPKVSAP